MKARLLTLCAAAALCLVMSDRSASAGDITDLVRGPVQMVNPLIPVLDVSTAVPTTQDILAVPVPRSNDLLNYPTHVIRYGLNVHPGARVARRNGFMLFEF
ncbi:MAG: hypothetical protein KDA85_08210 [Planctomycetaceae bacterium]|nr:hypothetical protein [Planctomycetaceae bacterium]